MTQIYRQFIFILLLGLIIRVVTIQFFGDIILENEWGTIVRNLQESEIFGFRTFGEKVYPTIYMPPLYPYLLYILKISSFFSETNFVLYVLYFQLLVSILTIIIFKKLLDLFFSNFISMIGVLIFTFFPLNIYSVAQISSVCIYVFLSIMFFYLLFNFIKKRKLVILIYFSFISSLLILIRGEFFLIYLISLIFIYFQNKVFKNIITSFVITLLLVSPYLVRNYLIFDSITITKSSGYNLWKGNNKFSNSEGSEIIINQSLKNEIDLLKPSNTYDLEFDNLFKNQAIKNLKEEPYKYLLKFFEKAFSFFFVDLKSTYPDYYNILHIFPKIILGILSILGGIQIFNKSIELKYLFFYYLFYGAIFSVFFILPRYSLMLLPVQVILTCSFLSGLKIFNKIKKL
jgi:hypothetical protein